MQNNIIKKVNKFTEWFLCENIYFIMLCINIVLLNIFVGSTHNDPRTILETIIILETLIYIIISKFKKKENILIKGKIDIAIIIMLVSTCIPLIFKTYCSLSYTIDIAIMYLTIYCIFILVRNLITTPKRKNIFLNVILIYSCLIILFGIDRINFNILQKLYDILRLPQVNDTRMTSTIGYWNAVFAYIGSLIMIALGKFIDSENKASASFYSIYIGFAMFAIYYCNSRAGMIIFAIIFIVFMIRLKNANKAIQSILLILFTYIFVTIFDKINTLYNNVFTVTSGVIATLIATYILSKIIKQIKMKNVKKDTLIFIIIFVVLISSYIIIAKNYSQPFELNKWGNTITLYGLKNNNKYKIKVDLTNKKGSELTIRVYQIDKEREKKKIYEKKYTEKEGKILEEFEIETSQENMDKLQIQFEGEKDSNWIFNKVYLNEKEEIVNYKYLPNSIIRLVKTLNFNNISIMERISMYKSGFKLFLIHPLVGNGAKTFQNMYERVREYSYSTMEIHSFYMDILIDYGTIGICACLGIIVITIYNFIKRKDKKNIINISIFMSFGFVMIHTMFDFDLSYMLTLSNFYIIIALINEEDTNFNKDTKIVEYIMIIVMIICIITNIFKLPGENLYREGKYKEAMKYIPFYAKNTERYIETVEESDENLKKDILIKYLKNEKNINQYKYINLLYNISLNLITRDNVDDGIEGLETIIDLIEKDEVIAKYDIYDKEKWKKFTYNMKNDIKQINKNLNNDKLEMINTKIQNINS